MDKDDTSDTTYEKLGDTTYKVVETTTTTTETIVSIDQKIRERDMMLQQIATLQEMVDKDNSEIDEATKIGVKPTEVNNDLAFQQDDQVES